MKPKPQKNQGKFNKKPARAGQKLKPNFKKKQQKSVCKKHCIATSRQGVYILHCLLGQQTK